MTPERLAEIKARADAATKGPWKVAEQDLECWIAGPTVVQNQEGAFARPNAAFIAHAREDIPDLLAEVERLKSKTEDRVTELARKYHAMCFGAEPSFHDWRSLAGWLSRVPTEEEQATFVRVWAEEHARWQALRAQVDGSRRRSYGPAALLGPIGPLDMWVTRQSRTLIGI